MKVKHIILVVLLMAISALAGFYLSRRLPVKVNQTSLTEITSNPLPEDKVQQWQKDHQKASTRDPAQPTPVYQPDSEKGFSRTCSPDAMPTDISWKQWVRFSDPKEIFVKISTETAKVINPSADYKLYDKAQFTIRFFEFGNVNAGPYKDAKLLVSYFAYSHEPIESGEGNAGCNYQRFILQGDKLIQLMLISDKPDDQDVFNSAIDQLHLKYETDNTLNIALFQKPLKHIELNGTCLNFSEQLPRGKDMSSKKMGTHSFYGDFYLVGHYFQTSLPDGTTLSYYFLPPPELDTAANASFTCFSPPGKRETSETPDLVRFDEEINENDLKVLMTTPSLGKIYIPKNEHHPSIESLYKDYEEEYKHYSKYKKEYGNQEDFKTSNSLSYEEYVKKTPVFFWQDPFGRYIRCENTNLRFPSMAEPLIYLYPLSSMKIEVNIDQRVHLHESIPEALHNGWEVMANPTGELTFLKDHHKYSHLYWEGKYAPLAPPEKGFVVEKENVSSFLKEKLNLLGLNENESKDFIDYWVPKLTRHPFYLITFLDQKTIDELAPLNIKPKPDTMIRVMMDSIPLDTQINIPPIRISPAKNREGFTAVEWGGIAR